MNNILRMQILQAMTDSINKRLGLRKSKHISSSQNIIDRAVLANLKVNVNILIIFEVVIKLHNVLVM
jgi:hypothetical protein